MKEKIFNALKQEYKALGLSDEILQGHANALAAIGLVTDENLSAVVAAQKDFLTGLQSGIDKRVTTAREKALADAKKTEDEAKAEAERKKAEEDAKKAAENKDKPEWQKEMDKRFRRWTNASKSSRRKRSSARRNSRLCKKNTKLLRRKKPSLPEPIRFCLKPKS